MLNVTTAPQHLMNI